MKSLRNFIVGIGFKYDESGEKKASSGMDNIRSKALQLGAVVAGAFGAKALTLDFAAANDTLGKFALAMGEDAGTVAALGDALQHAGGDAATMRAQLQQLAEMRAGLLTGDAGWLEAVGKAGIDPNIITNAKNATDAYFALADAFAKMTTEQRINAAASLGFDQSAILLLSEGRDNLEQIVEKMRAIRPRTDEMTEAAAQFNDELQDATNHVGRIADAISTELLPVINDLLGDFNEFMSSEGVDTALGVVKDVADYLRDDDAPSLNPLAWDADDVKQVLGLDLPDWVFSPIGGSDPEAVSVPGGMSSMMTKPGNMAPVKVDVSLNLDGEVIDRRVVKVTERANTSTIDELETGVRG